MLRVFTAFSGYDSQCLALNRIGIEYELVGWSEIDKHAIKAHNARYFALLNISYLCGKKRYNDIYKNEYLRAIHIYPYRIHCYKNNENTGHSSPVNYAWFEFGHNPRKYYKPDAINPPKIYWIEK